MNNAREVFQSLAKASKSYGSYYPFGLTQTGISSKALNFGDPENKKKYNGIEKIGDLGLEDYDAQFRELDPQIGRWWEIDPKVDNMEMWSPYTSNFDNTITYMDPLGDVGESANECCKGVIEDILIFGASAANAFATNQVGGIGRADPKVFGDDHSAAVSQSGLILGDMLTLLGAILTDIGGTVVAIGSAGTLALPAAGLMIQQTTIAAPTAFRNLMNDLSPKNNKSNLSSPSNSNEKNNTHKTNSPGTTASGQPTDKYGNKLGPSGEPQINEVRHSTLKGAKEAARNSGKGNPVKHPSPKKGFGHYHPIDKNNKKIPNSTHHVYPQ